MNPETDQMVLKIEGPEYKLEQPEDIEHSYFRKEYRRAFEVVETIVRQTIQKQKSASADAEQKPIQNIIPFIGRRGSGKTSAMMSFANLLEQYSPMPDGFEKPLFYELKDVNGRALHVRFTGIDCIDGSLLEQGEDIFKIILAQMFAKFEKKNSRSGEHSEQYSYYRRELQQQFDAIYRNACKMEYEEPEAFYESAILSLKSLSSSLTIRASFQELVRDYLSLMVSGENKLYPCPADSNAAGQFLVIAIDDIDLNVRNGFDMLEKIHRYLMVDHVIVLLAVDYDQLKLLCERSFFEILPKFDNKLNEKYREIECLARDFLDKVLSANERIYIPDLKKTTKVVVQQDFSSCKCMGMKQALFVMLYRKLGMRMDVEGEKRHFYEQNTLRIFVNFYLMLDRMQEPQGADQLAIYERNYYVLMSDTIIRMVDERLTNSYKKSFRHITGRKLPYSARGLYFEVLKLTREKQGLSADGHDSGIHSLQGLVKNLEFYGYSYGEILRIIYCWGRVDKEGKEMIRCLLAYYSLEMTGSYYRSFFSAIPVEPNGSDVFVNVMNGSVAGSWTNKIFPRIFTSDRPTGELIGARVSVKMGRAFHLRTQMKELKEIYRVQSGFSMEDVLEKRYFLDEMRKLFRAVLVLGMFFERQYYKAGKTFAWNLEYPHILPANSIIQMMEDELSDNISELRFYNTGGMGIFNLFGFVSNAYQYEKNVFSLMQSLFKLLFPGTGNKDWERFALRLGIAKEFRDWAKYSKGFALPVYDMDLCYNLMKRVRQRERAVEIDVADAWGEFREMLRFIQQKLEKNDRWYMDVGIELKPYVQDEVDEGYDIRLADAFTYCPYVKWVLNDGQMLPDDFPRMFAELLSRLLLKGNSEAVSLGEDKEYSGYDD